jgi:hypothetical protein
MKPLFIVIAAIELGAGLALFCCPSLTVALLIGSGLDNSAAVTLGRVAGAALSALGFVCWLARDDTHSRAARGLVITMLLYNVAVAAILAFASNLGASESGRGKARRALIEQKNSTGANGENRDSE